jgi:crotonobetainyl-CoA:carnitine CoA-transferase CaiB-like acyl-CoA transferase
MPRKPFEGIRVADFAWVGVGPITSKYLADHGAEVIRIESSLRPEALRLAPPFLADEPGYDRSGYYANFNSSKLGITLNMTHPRAVWLAKRLVARCDVVTESFTPRAMRKWGLGYEDLRQIQPDLVMISMPLFGQTGPWSQYLGYGHVLQAAAGINHLTGWPDGPPIGTGIAYTDFFVPHVAAIALIAALDYRRRTGEGQYIDFGQLEAALYATETAVLDYTVNGREQTRRGNRDVEMAPHGCYPCRGEDRWVTIACRGEDDWSALKAKIGAPWAADERFKDLAGRLANEDELDRRLSDWTSGQAAEEVMASLQAAGVPAGVVQTAEDLRNDPQLAHRKHYRFLEHPVMGVRAYDGPSFRLSRTPGELTKAAPCLGESNSYVYRELLGLSEDEFVDLLADGCFD